MAPPEQYSGGRCPRCGAPHDPYQEYCLECGARIPPPYPVGRRLWSRESPAWLWAALAALLLVALVAGAVVAVVAAGNEEQPAATRVAVLPGTTATQTVEIVTGPGTVTLPPATITVRPPTVPVQPPPTVTAPGATTVAPPAGGPAAWPAGKNGFTIVLSSVPTSAGRAEADATAKRALGQGVTAVGVLDSSKFSSLRPGFFVVFSGVYDTLKAAQGALGQVRSSGFPLAYVREIRR